MLLKICVLRMLTNVTRETSVYRTDPSVAASLILLVNFPVKRNKILQCWKPSFFLYISFLLSIIIIFK